MPHMTKLTWHEHLVVQQFSNGFSAPWIQNESSPEEVSSDWAALRRRPGRLLCAANLGRKRKRLTRLKWTVSCRAEPPFWVGSHCTKWRIKGRFHSSSSRSFNVKTLQTRNSILSTYWYRKFVKYIFHNINSAQRKELPLDFISTSTEFTWPWRRTLTNGIDSSNIYSHGAGLVGRVTAPLGRPPMTTWLTYSWPYIHYHPHDRQLTSHAPFHSTPESRQTSLTQTLCRHTYELNKGHVHMVLFICWALYCTRVHHTLFLEQIPTQQQKKVAK